MSYSENVTKNDLKEVFTQLGLGVSFGQTYEADWTATSTNALDARCTDSIYLPAGKYICFIKLPVVDQNTLAFCINGEFSRNTSMFATGQQMVAIPFECTEYREVYAVTAMSIETNYTYIERGFLKAICISDMKQYGTTVLDYYPVGSYYETTDSTFNPNNAWGGTWTSEQTKDDEIVEESTDGIWTYRKWKSGVAECWGKRTVTVNITNSWGSLYISTTSIKETYPANLFIEAPIDEASLSSNYSGILMPFGSYPTSATETAERAILKGASGTNQHHIVNYYSKGYWKTYTAPTTIYRWHRTA